MASTLKFALIQLVMALLTVPLSAQDITISELDLTFNSHEVSLSAEAEDYIQSVVDIMRKDAIHRQRLNFDHIHQAIRFYADGAEKIEDTHAAIKKVMPLLRDHHSYFMTSAEVVKTLGFTSDDIAVIKTGRAPHVDPNRIEDLKKRLKYSSGKIVSGRVGYLSVPAFDNLYHEAMTMFADSLQRIIQTLDQQDLAGRIIDLRHNSGGADMPMITGLGPLLDSNNVYYSVDEKGAEKGRAYYRDGGYYNVDAGEEIGAPLVQSAVDYQLQDRTLPVAILTGFRTASSAEAVTAIFAGQANVKIIGRKTNGLTTVNNFNFLEDNSVLNLTIGYYANRDHQMYRQGIVPDLLIKHDGESKRSESDDVVLQKAVEWLLN